MGCSKSTPSDPDAVRPRCRVVVNISEDDLNYPEFSRTSHGPKQVYINHLGTVIGEIRGNSEWQWRVSMDVVQKNIHVKDQWVRICDKSEEIKLDACKPFLHQRLVGEHRCQLKNDIMHTMTSSGKPYIPTRIKRKNTTTTNNNKSPAEWSRPRNNWMPSQPPIKREETPKKKWIPESTAINRNVEIQTSGEGTISSIVEPSAPPKQYEDWLRGCLENHGLGALYDQLKALGVEKEEDLNLVRESDLDCSVITMRKFGRLRRSEVTGGAPPMYNQVLEAPPAYSTVI